MPKLHIGCGNIHYKECINIDLKSLEGVDVIADMRHLPFKDGCVDAIIAHQTFEHIARQENVDVLEEWHRILKKGGYLDIEMPDFDQNCRDYVKALDDNDIDKQIINKAFIYGGDSPASEDGHRWGYSPRLMEIYLEPIGFEKVATLEPTEFHKDQAACFRMMVIK